MEEGKENGGYADEGNRDWPQKGGLIWPSQNELPPQQSLAGYRMCTCSVKKSDWWNSV